MATSHPAVLSGPRRPWRLAAALALALLGGCSGWQVGAESLFPADIQTVAVPVFESDSLRRNLAEWLTEAVCKEIEARSTYKVTREAGADSVLIGRIVGEQKNTVVGAITGDPRQQQIDLRVQITWIDRRGNTLREQSMPIPKEMTDVMGSGITTAEVGQSTATAFQTAIVKVAQQIVGLMEKPW